MRFLTLFLSPSADFWGYHRLSDLTLTAGFEVDDPDMTLTTCLMLCDAQDSVLAAVIVNTRCICATGARTLDPYQRE